MRRLVLRALAIPVALLALLAVLPNTAPGRRLIEAVVARASDGAVRLEGLAGRFPDALQLARLELRDADGGWLVAEEVALDIALSALWERRVLVNRLAVARLALDRLPSGGGGGRDFELPLPVAVESVEIGRLALGGPVLGRPAVVAVAGKAAFDSTTEGRATVTLRPATGDGEAVLDGRIDAAGIDATLRLREPAGGIAAGLAGLPTIGALDLEAAARGPWAGLAVRLVLGAGQLRATAEGTLDLPGRTLSLAVEAAAPAMAPRPDLSWGAVALKAEVAGRFDAPAGRGTLRITDLAAFGATASLISAELHGDTARATAEARAEALMLPGPRAKFFAAAPLTLRATVDLHAADRPVQVALRHPRLALSGTLRTLGEYAGELDLALPDLTAFEPALVGSARAAIRLRLPLEGVEAAVDGEAMLASAPLPALGAAPVRFALAGRHAGGRTVLDRLRVAGAGATLEGDATLDGAALAARYTLTVADLAALAPQLHGALILTGTAAGRTDALNLDATLTGQAGTEGFPAAPLDLTLRATGIPDAPVASLAGSAMVAGDPARLSARIARAADGTLGVTIEQAGWRSLAARAQLALAPGALLPTGEAELRAEHLADLRWLPGGVDGSLVATARFDGAGRTAAKIEARNLGPVRQLTLDAAGPPEALVLRLSAASDWRLAADATLDLAGRALLLTGLRAGFKGQSATLLAPARFAFADGLTVDRLRLGLGHAGFEVTGRLLPALDLDATLRDLPVALLAALAGGPAAEGTLRAQAKLTGAPARPEGMLRVEAQGLRLPGMMLPAGSLSATATLAGAAARLDAKAAFGPNAALTLAGRVPLDAGGALDLRGTGRASLTLLDPLLAPAGRRARGDVTLDAAIAGRLAAPAVTGTLRLARGALLDAPAGLRLRRIEGVLRADGERVTIERLEGMAGQGTIAVTGTLGLGAGMPVDLRLAARRARPVASDLLTVIADADLALRGSLEGGVGLSGAVTLEQVDIRVPDRLPVSLPTLDARPIGRPAPPPQAPMPAVALDITVAAPGRIFVRGRGLDAEVGGSLRMRGTADMPVPDGAFTLRRGRFNLLGRPLDLTSGKVTLDAAARLDPELDFAATTSAQGITVKVAVAGRASAPRVTLSSDPELPQDEVLAQLLLGRSKAQLGPAQLAQLAAALAELSGNGLPFNPLERLRAGLGLDRLSVGSGEAGGASIEAGRSLGRGVYVGVRQGLDGGGSRGVVEVDLGRGLKLQGELGTGAGTPPPTGASSSGGAGVGLIWSREW